MLRRFALAAGAVLVLANTGPRSAAFAAPDPYSIFEGARHVWAGQHYPGYLAYTVTVRVTEHGVHKSRHYHSTYDTQNNMVDVNPISDEEAAAPPVPTGFVLHLQPKRQGRVLFDKKVGNPGDAVDYLGVPKLSPTYAFGLTTGGDIADGPDSAALIAQIRREFNDPVPAGKVRAQVMDSGMKVIASVTSRTRDYDIVLAGIESVDGVDAYHLLLNPKRDPQTLRLRQLWIDTQSYQTRQLLAAGNFTGSRAPWLIKFAQIDGSTYIASETAQAPIGVGDHRYDRAAIEFAAIAPTVRPAHVSNFFAAADLIAEPGSGPQH